jgi:hypothetical protein
MPFFIFSLLLNLVAQAVQTARRNKRKTVPEPLCTKCINAHVQYGANGRRAISCAFGGVVQRVKLDVLYCTSYQTRNQPTPSAIGFVYQIAPAE